MSALTQSLAYHAVAFLFQQVLERPLAEARFSQTRLPVVLTYGAVRGPCGGFHWALEYYQDPGYGGATTRMSGKPNPAFWFLGRGSASSAVRRHPSAEKGLRAGPTPPIFTGSHRL